MEMAQLEVSPWMNDFMISMHSSLGCPILRASTVLVLCSQLSFLELHIAMHAKHWLQTVL